jgi:chemotaxis methyl-accepting protein methylase
MAYLEFAGKANSNLPLQIFATDLNDALLEKARAGFTPKTSCRTSRLKDCGDSLPRKTAAIASTSQSAKCVSSRGKT